MEYLFQVGDFFNDLSDQCDKIRRLDRDHFKHHTDMEIMEEVIQNKIDELEKVNKGD